MGSNHFSVWALLLTCLILVPSLYRKDEVNAKSLDSFETAKENEVTSKYDGQNNKETKKKKKKMKQINRNKKGLQNKKTKKNGKTKKRGKNGKGKGKHNGKQENKDENKNSGLSSTNSVEALEGFLVEGDMILDKYQLQLFTNGDLDGVNENKTDDVQKGHRNARTETYYHWDHNTVYYSFDQSVTHTRRQLIRTKLDNLKKKISGCLSFEEKESNPKRIVVTTTKSNTEGCRNNGCCQSYVGYIHRVQELELSASWCWNIGTIEHEFLHAIGIYHAHVRSDRDKYVTIMDGNIKPYAKGNFKCRNCKMSHHNLPYDYYSVMHYGKKGFTQNDQITIQTMDPSKQDAIGQRDEGVSIGDIQLVQQMYGCSLEVTNGRCYDSYPRSLPHVIHAGQDNSVEYCKARCYDAGFDYAGVEAWDWCFCGHYLPSNSLKRPSTECSSWCPADSSQFCGAGWRYNVFKTNAGCAYRQLKVSAGIQATQTQSHFIGKFNLLENVRHHNYPVWKREGYEAYIYVGWFNHKLRWMMGSNRHSSYLNIYNPRDPTPSYPPVDDWYFWNTQHWLNDGSIEVKPTEAFCDFVDGTCYEDDGSRLFDYLQSISNSMTPDECKKNCLKAGYAFAGVQYYRECWCGHQQPPYHKIKDSLECNANCRGDSSKKCGGAWRMNVHKTESSTHGSLTYLTSPNFPNNYANYEDVYHFLSVPEGHFIKINFIVFKIEDNYRCAYDYVQFYDGIGRKHGIFCGESKPPSFIIPTRYAKLHFHSDISIVKQGYQLTYQAVKLPGDHQETPYFDLDGGYWGDWGYHQKCQYPHFVTKMELKIEDKQSWGKDDSALNAIRLTCSNGQTITSVQGGEGRWRGVQSCPSEKFMVGAQIRRESKQSGDDTAANGVRFKCSDASRSSYSTKYPGDGYWGGWTSNSYCEYGSAVIGLATQVERDQGSGDDTCMNDVRFYCAKLPHIQIIYPGSNTVRTQTRTNLEETKEKKVPAMNITQTSADDTKTGRIANQINEDNTEMGRNSKQKAQDIKETNMNATQTNMNNSETVRSTNHTSPHNTLTGRHFNQTRMDNTKKDKNTNQTKLDNLRHALDALMMINK